MNAETPLLSFQCIERADDFIRRVFFNDAFSKNDQGPLWTILSLTQGRSSDLEFARRFRPLLARRHPKFFRESPKIGLSEKLLCWHGPMVKIIWINVTFFLRVLVCMTTLYAV